MSELETEVPMPTNDGRGRRKGEDRLSLERLFLAPKGTSVFFHFPTRPRTLSAIARAVGGSGWYAVRSEKLGVRVWNMRGPLVPCEPEDPNP